MNLTLSDINFTYDLDRIIKDVSCCFESGKFYSIVGPNGSGKTTLLDLISGFLIPGSGHISIDDTKISALSKKEASKHIALVSQDHSINFPFRVKDVVLMGRHPHIPRFSPPSGLDITMADTMMDVCGIRHLQDRKITTLSGGERQRCVFARALCQDTPILLLDEAFSNMDIRHTLHMLTLVKNRVKKSDTLVISVFHDLNLASTWSDGLLMLKQGRIKAFGQCPDILTPKTIKEVFGVTSIVEFNPHVQARQVYYPCV